MADNTGQDSKPKPQGENSTLSDLNNLHRQLAAPRSVFEPDWYLNVAYFNGNQWCFWNRGRIDKPQLEPWRVTVVDNRILPIATSRVARKTKNRPTFSVTPNSYGEDDVNNAILAEKTLDDDWLNLSLSRKLMNAQMWAEVCTAGFWKIYWDKTKGGGGAEYVVGPGGDAYLHPESQRPIPAGTEAADALVGLEGFSQQAVDMGDVCVEPLSPFNLYPDPLVDVSDTHECEIIIEENIRSVEYVKKHYGKTVTADTDIPSGIAEGRMLPMMQTASGGGKGYRGVTVRELYGKPGSKWGKAGKVAAWTKNEVLEERTVDDSAYAGCPYVMFPGIETPGRFWPNAITTHLRGPQTDLNKAKSQIRENATRLGNPAIAISRQTNTQYTGVPGEKIYYDSTVQDAIPSYLEAPPIPGYVENEVDRIESALIEISGLHEISKGNVPAGVTAASAINLLQEADDTRLGPEIYAMELALGKSGEKIIKLRAKYQTDERFIKSAGEDGEWDITTFRGNMMKDITNVEVQAGSMLPRSQAARQAAMSDLLAQLFQYGYDVKPRDLRKFLKDYGVGSLDSIFAGLSQSELQVKREHTFMLNEQPIPINNYDDDDFHIEGHQEFQRTKRYWNSSDTTKQYMELHVQAHMQRRTKAVNAQVAEQQKAMQTMNGAPSG